LVGPQEVLAEAKHGNKVLCGRIIGNVLENCEASLPNNEGSHHFYAALEVFAAKAFDTCNGAVPRPPCEKYPK
jgi:hypothetical protein